MIIVSHLKYFGYWPGSVSGFTSIADHAGSCNITKVISVAWNQNSNSWGDPSEDFRLVKEAGLQVLMNLPEGDDRTRFAEWAEVIKPYADQIFGFFMMDEPDCVGFGQPAKLLNLLEQIETDIREVQAHFPGARTMMTLGCFHDPVPPWFRLPKGLTDVAIEAYHGRHQWLTWIERLFPYLDAHKLWLMPYVAPFTGPEYLPMSDAEVIFEARTIYEYAKEDQRVVGIFPFMWYEGARDRSVVRDYFARIGREILARQIQPAVDTTLRLEQVVPEKVHGIEPFMLAFVGNHFAPSACVQYAMGATGPFFDFPARGINRTVLTLHVPAVPPGTYWVRVKNPDGEVTNALPIHVKECSR